MSPFRFAFAAALLTGCVWSPTDDGTVDTRLAPVPVTGFAKTPGDTLQVRAWNYDRAAWDVLGTAVSQTTAEQAGAGVPLYEWTSGLLLGDRYWRAGMYAACSTPALARVQVRERHDGDWIALKTFDSAGRACVLDALHDDPDYYDAGADCFTGDEVRIHAPHTCVTRQGSPDPTTYLTVSDDVTGYQRTTTWWSTFDFRDSPSALPDLAPRQPIRLRADTVDRRGPGGVGLTYTAWVTCRSANGEVSVPPAVSATRSLRTPPVGIGGPVPGTLGVAFDLSPTTLAATCPSDATATRIRISVSARSLDFDGAQLGLSVAAKFEMWL